MQKLITFDCVSTLDACIARVIRIYVESLYPRGIFIASYDVQQLSYIGDRVNFLEYWNIRARIIEFSLNDFEKYRRIGEC